ncbi:MAG TPA: DUF4147 domain-containing protein, partial [Candidatus Acidoferrum sp.]|nr:DUF4147 domain-containing protein [Candidatus Acidoferrum sp.]
MDRKHLARQIFQRTLAAVEPSAAIERCLAIAGGRLFCADRVYELSRFPDVRVLAVGKAAHGMLDGLLAVMPHGTRLRGIVSAPAAPGQVHTGFKYFEGGHPEPNDGSLLAGQAALDLVENATPETLLIVLLSGGGSALLESPLQKPLSLAELRQLNRELVTCGASIHEINTVRKHVSAVKGGRLARAAHPATILTLAISDVPSGRESALASGPTLPDPTTCAETRSVIARHHLRERLPRTVLSFIDSEAMPETPKAGDAVFAGAQFQLILGMHELFHAAHRFAEAERFLACCDNSTDDWPVEKAANALLAQLEDLQSANPHQAVALIADGEVSSAVTGDGRGGRNAAFVLACVEKIAGKPIVVLSAGTDGIDGNSPAAGAVADGNTLARATEACLDPGDFFRRSDA